MKRVDTVSAEWPAKTNYLYLTYNGDYHDEELQPLGKEATMVIGNIKLNFFLPESLWITIMGLLDIKNIYLFSFLFVMQVSYS